MVRWSEESRQVTTTLAVSADDLIFGEGERGPDDQLKLQFEALRQFNDQEKLVAKEILDSLILKHTANRLAGQGTLEGKRRL